MKKFKIGLLVFKLDEAALIPATADKTAYIAQKMKHHQHGC